MDKTLIVAPWGQPASWRSVVYVLDGAERQSCTSLSLLSEQFRGEDADVVILALDSLVDEYDREGESSCYTCYVKYRNTIRESVTAKSYNELRQKLVSFITQFVECLELPCAPSVVICPAIGIPGGNWRFPGSPSDFEAVALYELGKRCIETAYIRIVLDLSHGINFMPAVAMKLASELASIILAAHGGNEEELVNGVEL